MILETERLRLRDMRRDDYPALCKMLKDDDVMYAWEGALSEEEVQDWMDRNFERYAKYGYGCWAVELKNSPAGEMIGQCGITMLKYNGTEVPEISYIFQKAYWHRGYATEAAIACKNYAFDKLNIHEIFSDVRDNNIPSMNVLIRTGMTIKDRIIKHYRGIDMPHFVFSAKK